MNRLRYLIVACVVLIVCAIFASRVVRPSEIQPDFRASLLNSSEEEVRCRLGEPILCVDQGDGRKALAYPACHVNGSVKPVVVYFSEDRAVSVTSRGVELPH